MDKRWWGFEPGAKKGAYVHGVALGKQSVFEYPHRISYESQMIGLFDGLGKRAADAFAKAKWTFSALTGTEQEALAAEQGLGSQMAAGFLEEYSLVNDGEAVAHFREVASQLVKCLTDTRRKYQFGCFVCGAPQTVAFPGGYIFVSLELLAQCDGDPDIVAAIIGHEIGHIVKNHAFDRAMASQFVRMISAGAMVGGPLKRTILGAVGQWLDKGYGQDQEQEADQFAARLAHAAGYHPAGLIRFLTLLAPEAMAGPYWESHPPSNLRAQALRGAF